MEHCGSVRQITVLGRDKPAKWLHFLRTLEHIPEVEVEETLQMESKPSSTGMRASSILEGSDLSSTPLHPRGRGWHLRGATLKG